MPDIAYVNGVFSPLDKAVISINDRGFQFGDSVYEVLRTVDGTPHSLPAHLKRLTEACSNLGFDLASHAERIPAILVEGLARAGHAECLIYIQATRGIQLRNHIFEKNLSPSLIVTFREFQDTFQRSYQTGVPVRLVPDQRHGLCNFKTTNLLAHILVKNEARTQGAFEGILVGEDEQVHEGCSSTVFIVEGNTILTPPIGRFVLPGVTRENVLRSYAPALGLSTREEPISVTRLLNADEAFLATTSYFVLPITKIDETPISAGTPGEVATRLVSEYQRRLAESPPPSEPTESTTAV